ncbi:hypothetical protein AALB39_20210 [Lachnospiraceae bacterium 54-53]
MSKISGFKFAELSRFSTGRPGWGSISNTGYIVLSLVSVAGFFSAVLTNLFFPQIVPGQVNSYPVGGGFSLTADQAYCLVLAGLMLIYGGIGAYSFFDGGLRKKYISRVPFRLAVGLALALWDILGTKLLLNCPGNRRHAEDPF